MFIIPFTIIVSLMVILNAVAIIYAIVIHHRDKRSLQEQSNMLYILMKKLTPACDDIENIKKLYSTLSSSIDLYNDAQNAQLNAYPSPELIKAIELSIEDYLKIEMTLSSDLRIVKSDSVRKVMEMLIQTYPTVNKEYLIKKCSAYIKGMFENAQFEDDEKQ